MMVYNPPVITIKIESRFIKSMPGHVSNFL
jgi:hypothetical protein